MTTHYFDQENYHIENHIAEIDTDLPVIPAADTVEDQAVLLIRLDSDHHIEVLGVVGVFQLELEMAIPNIMIEDLVPGNILTVE